MAKATKDFEAGKYYKVKLAKAVSPLPGVTYRPGPEHRFEGEFLNLFKEAVQEAVEDHGEPVKQES